MDFGNVINPLPVTMSFQKPKEVAFSPYENNQGSVAAIAGDDFVVMAADTRLSTGYSIYSRNQSKIFKLSDKTVVGISGCWCDTLTFVRILETRFKDISHINKTLIDWFLLFGAHQFRDIDMYQHEHNKEMSTPAVAQLITSLLYYKRFFPYYVNCIVAGLDSDGKGRCFSYDPVGHKGEDIYESSGSAFSLIAPLLDNQIGHKNLENVRKEPLTLEMAIRIMKDVFISAAERDIYTGDSVLLKIITKDGIKEETYPLRRD